VRRHRLAISFLLGLGLTAGLTLAAAAPGSSPEAQTTGADASASAKADALAVLLNRARVHEGLKPLARNADLDRAAQEHSRDMAEHRYLDHTAPDGSEPMDRAIKAGYGARQGTGWIVVEVISAISGDPEGPLNWWLNESPNVHGRVLRNPRWREMGVGYAAGGEYGNYWTVLVGCQPGILPLVTLDGQTYQHAEECDPSAPPPAAKVRLVPTPRTDQPGARRVEARWEGLPQPRPTDWIGLYRPGDADRDYLAWRYLSCSDVAGDAPADGVCVLPVPPGVPGGEYELRLLREGGYVQAARSDQFTLPAGPRLATESFSVRPGDHLRVTWSGLLAPGPRDWIGLYPANRPDHGSAAWLYVSCRTAPNEARPDGACDLDVPPSLEPGLYEVRLFADDGLAPVAATAVSVAPSGSAVG
jgi:uncharacterized protein YkwD